MKETSTLNEDIRQVCQENIHEFHTFGPNFLNIEICALEKYKIRKKKRRITLFVRVITATIIAIVALNAFVLFSETEPVRAYRAEIRHIFYSIFNDKSHVQTESEIVKSTTEIRKLQSSIPFTLPIPSWLPDTFIFDNSTMYSDIH